MTHDQMTRSIARRNRTATPIYRTDLRWKIEDATDFSVTPPAPCGFYATHPLLGGNVLGRGDTPREAKADAIRRYNEDQWTDEASRFFALA